MNAEPQIKLIGPPSLSIGGARVDFPGRKAAALCIFLAAHGGRRVERGRLAGLLWGESDAEAARASLRKALSLIGASPGACSLIAKDRTDVWFASDPTRSDLASFNRCLGAGTERAYREALRLWTGEPLQELELGEPLFDDWVASFRAETAGLTHKLLSQRLALIPPVAGNTGLQIALCELIVKLEPSDGEANERLIRILAQEGYPSAAARQYRSYARALRDLDLTPPRALARAIEEGHAPSDIDVPAARAPTLGVEDRPTVALVRPRGSRPTPDLFSFAHAELVHQLTRFRTMRCFERDDGDGVEDGGALVSRIGLSDALDHDYRLLLWDEPKARAIYLRCINVRRQDTVSSVRIGYDVLEDRDVAETMIASSINSLEQDIVSDNARASDAPFGRWLEAYKLLTQWNPTADRAALTILEDLATDDRGKRLSLVHSSISSILMIRRLMLPADAAAVEADRARARECAIRAIAIDELEPFNHVILGWMHMQNEDHARSIVAFDDAMELNPFSSRTLIAAAEANAYSGALDRAQTLADRAIKLSGRYTPAYYFHYLANIAYLRRDLDACIEHLRKAPDNIHSALLLVAANEERGDAEAAAAARVRFDRELRSAEPQATIDRSALSKWIVSSNMNSDPNVKRRLFGALERAGLPVGSIAR
ncbi:BTAD domain-containing putative transcriptional regulator [Acuticoccus sp.]|uniref:BTAD domain-containing putative transcriptional regulator n=1 Tax=Acuticoccus sp. TaxID=1904378 RepID=UPI003B528663